MKAWIRAFASVGLPLVGIVISLFGYQLWMAPAINAGFVPGQTLVALHALVPFTVFLAAFFAHTWGELVFMAIAAGSVFSTIQSWLSELGAFGLQKLEPSPLALELVFHVLLFGLPALVGWWLSRTIRRARGFPDGPAGLAPVARQLASLCAVTIVFVVLGWFSLSPQVRDVLATRCTEEGAIEARAVAAQQRLWQSVGERHVAGLELHVMLSAGFCGAPHKTLCSTFIRSREAFAGVPMGSLIRRMEEVCAGEFDQTDLGRSFGGGG